MRQTRNAFNFLVAHYRSILMRARKLGLAAALIIPAMLCEASFAAPSDMVIDGSEPLSIIWKADATEDTNLIIKGEDLDNPNMLMAEGDGSGKITVKWDGNFKIDTGNNDQGLTISAKDTDLVIDFNSISHDSGLLKLISDADHSLQLSGLNVFFQPQDDDKSLISVKGNIQIGDDNAVTVLGKNSIVSIYSDENTPSNLTLSRLYSNGTRFDFNGDANVMLPGLEKSFANDITFAVEGSFTANLTTKDGEDSELLLGEDSAIILRPDSPDKASVFAIGATDANWESDGGKVSVTIDPNAQVVMSNPDEETQGVGYITVRGFADERQKAALTISEITLHEFLENPNADAGYLVLQDNAELTLKSDKVIELKNDGTLYSTDDDFYLPFMVGKAEDLAATDRGKLVFDLDSMPSTLKADKMRLTSTLGTNGLLNLDVNELSTYISSYSGLNQVTVHDNLVLNETDQTSDIAKVLVLDNRDIDSGQHKFDFNNPKLFSSNKIDSEIKVTAGDWAITASSPLIESIKIDDSKLTVQSDYMPTKLTFNTKTFLHDGSEINVTSQGIAPALLDLNKEFTILGEVFYDDSYVNVGNVVDLQGQAKTNLLSAPIANGSILKVSDSFFSDFLGASSTSLSLGNNGVLILDPDWGDELSTDQIVDKSQREPGKIIISASDVAPAYIINPDELDLSVDSTLNLYNSVLMTKTLDLDWKQLKLGTGTLAVQDIKTGELFNTTVIVGSSDSSMPANLIFAGSENFVKRNKLDLEAEGANSSIVFNKGSYDINSVALRDNSKLIAGNGKDGLDLFIAKLQGEAGPSSDQSVAGSPNIDAPELIVNDSTMVTVNDIDFDRGNIFINTGGYLNVNARALCHDDISMDSTYIKINPYSVFEITDT